MRRQKTDQLAALHAGGWTKNRALGFAISSGAKRPNSSVICPLKSLSYGTVL
ncbi:MAG: hypothetical protein LBD06_02195 [Candidatus Accumulibacter sp.]|nr:hypothetical protein [Accumulibacter sp.]